MGNNSINSSDRAIIVFHPNQQPELLQGSDRLLNLPEIDITLSVEQVFSWLKMQSM
ncbi:hypothetical protein [Nostoc sp. PCC 7107]|uniref:hypothetical protein n=1 Tax=Nostoc sp. PCC 7107 TaxID=317936 RepID=UPI0002D29811|nr:hypothetical protein [Nostoc sp. PCC 7107]